MDHKKNGDKLSFSILSSRDEVFYVDETDIKIDEQSLTPVNVDNNTFIKPNINAFSISWPYIAFSTIPNILTIFNAFRKQEIHMIEMTE